MHLPQFIQDLGIILLAAGAVILFFKRIGQPIVLGYLIAGFLVGPEINFLPTVEDKESVKVWAEIGVIFLLFALGLEFSFKKLFAVGRGASITATTEVLFMLGLGYLTGQAFGWSQMDSLFLGGILSISSTTIILKAFEELGYKQKGFVSLVFGVLIVEDLVAILLLVLLSTIAVSNALEGTQLVFSSIKLGFFLSIWFVGGIFLIPSILQKSRRLLNEETMVIVSLGLCLLMVQLATKAGFSAALGAFIMGSILAETPDAERIERTIRPVRDLFAAIFFVSVGMLIEIEPIKENLTAVVAITFVTIFGKIFSTTIGALIGGQSIRTSIQAGFSLAQIGEFSFIIATLGLTLGVISNFLYPIAVAVSAVTTLATPYLIRSSGPVYDWLHERLPEKLKNRASSDVKVNIISQKLSTVRGEIFKLSLHVVLAISVGIAVKVWLGPLVANLIGDSTLVEVILIATTLILASPFLWAIVNGSSLMRAKNYRLDDIRDLTAQAMLAIGSRIFVSLFVLAFLVAQFTSVLWTFLVLINIALIVGYFGAKNFSKIYFWLEDRFLKNLNEKEIAHKSKNPPIAPWDAHLSRISVSPDSAFVGRRLIEIGIREKYGVTIAMIERGSRQILAPRRDEFIMAHDVLVAIGTDEQLTAFAEIAEISAVNLIPDGNHRYELKSFTLVENSPWIGRSIRDSGIRELTDGLIVGIERNGQRILNPDSTHKFELGDNVWIVGDPEKVPS